MAFQEPPVWL